MLYLFHTGNIFVTIANFKSAVAFICLCSALRRPKPLKQRSELCRVIFQFSSKEFDCGSVMYCFTVLWKMIVRRWKMIVKRSETMVGCSDPIVLHLKLNTISILLYYCTLILLYCISNLTQYDSTNIGFASHFKAL